MSLITGTRLGPYEILDLIDARGTDEAYKARDTRLKRDIALTILPMAVATDRDRLGRFQREAELLAAVNHPCIAQIHGFEQTTDSSALIMELVDAEDRADCPRAHASRRSASGRAHDGVTGAVPAR